MTEYDPKIIQKMADRLYSEASLVTAKWTTGLGLLGLVLGAIPGIAGDSAGWALGGAVVAALAAGGIGYAIGIERTFQIRLRAQQFLTQLQIERNTADIKALLLTARTPCATAPSGPPASVDH
jgi:hypothetical protein